MDESDEEESRADGRVGGSLSVGEKRGVQRGGEGEKGGGISRVLGFIPLDCRRHRHRWMLRVAGPRA